MPVLDLYFPTLLYITFDGHRGNFRAQLPIFGREDVS